MRTSGLVTYAVWFSIKGRRVGKLKAALELLAKHLHTESCLELQARDAEAELPSLHLEVAPEFHLIHIEEHCSPGDICGALKLRVLEPTDKVVAVRVDPAWYIPDQGLRGNPADKEITGQFRARFFEFMDIPRRYVLTRPD